MPRTKAAKKKTVAIVNKKATEQGLREFQEEVAALRQRIINVFEDFQTETDINLKTVRMQIPKHLLNKTIAELRSGVPETTVMEASTMVSMLHSKKLNSTAKKPRRSVSCSDEGYLTAESNASGPSTRRSALKGTNSRRTTRSLSRNKPEPPASCNKYKTPANHGLSRPMHFGTITPKMKPNTPQIILRRPKQGEVAVSMQGSPLLVSGVGMESTASVNIPLSDGRIMTVQPQRGLRVSEVPSFDTSVQEQIQLLQENLKRMCEVMNKKALS